MKVGIFLLPRNFLGSRFKYLRKTFSFKIGYRYCKNNKIWERERDRERMPEKIQDLDWRWIFLQIERVKSNKVFPGKFSTFETIVSLMNWFHVHVPLLLLRYFLLVTFLLWNHYPPSQLKTQYFDLSKASGNSTFDGNKKTLKASLFMGSKTSK